LAVYLVAPRTRGIERVRAMLSDQSGALVNRALKTLAQQAATRAAAAPSVTVQTADAKVQEPPSERLGRYTVIKTAGVMPTMQTLKGGVLFQLNVGQVIEVLEIVSNEEERRVRARIAEPPGWISLANMDTGTRWAVHVDDVNNPALTAPFGAQTGEVLANAAAAGCDLGALFGQTSATVVSEEVPEDVAWEAMALLESQLARADDASEDAASRQASTMLRTMLGTLVQTGNPAMLSMAQAMMPDLRKIWANASTREYLKGLLSDAAAAPAASSSSTAGPSSADGQASSSTAAAGINANGLGGAAGSSANGSLSLTAADVSSANDFGPSTSATAAAMGSSSAATDGSTAANSVAAGSAGAGSATAGSAGVGSAAAGSDAAGSAAAGSAGSAANGFTAAAGSLRR